MLEKIFISIPGLGNIKVITSEAGIISLRFVKRRIITKNKTNSFTASFIKELLEKELKLYVNGRLKEFSVPIDLSYISGFTKDVLEEVRKIPYGKTITYKELALAIGKPHAARAVGNSLSKNPVPIIIPCHRVIKTNGSLGGFSSGIAIKKKLLSIEKSHYKSG